MIIAAAMLHNLLVQTHTYNAVIAGDNKEDHANDAEGGIDRNNYHVAENHRRREDLKDQMMEVQGLTADDIAQISFIVCHILKKSSV